MLRSIRTSIVSAGVITAVCGAASGQTFVGNLAVSQVGRSANGQAQGTALSAAASTTSIRDYSATLTSATLNQTYYFNDGSTGTRLVLAGTATSAGFVRNSVNTRYVTIGGMDAAAGTAAIAGTASTAVNRVVGRLDLLTGAIDYTRIADPGYSADNIRSVITADGSQYWAAGTAGSAANGGVRFFAHDTITAQTSTQLSSSVTNTRTVDIFNGQLYVGTGSGTFNGVNTVGTGLPTTTGQTITNLPSMDAVTDTNLSTYDYFFADANTLYVADDRTTLSGGLSKWTFNGSVWNLLWSLKNFDVNNDGTNESTTMGIRGLTGQVQSDGSVSLFAITNNHNFGGQTGGNSLVSFSDLLTGTTISGTAKFFTLDTSTQNTTFRGVDIVPAPGVAALAVLGGLVAGRRRRN